jgi:hypothetical protein
VEKTSGTPLQPIVVFCSFCSIIATCANSARFGGHSDCRAATDPGRKLRDIHIVAVGSARFASACLADAQEGSVRASRTGGRRLAITLGVLAVSLGTHAAQAANWYVDAVAPASGFGAPLETACRQFADIDCVVGVGTLILAQWQARRCDTRGSADAKLSLGRGQSLRAARTTLAVACSASFWPPPLADPASTACPVRRGPTPRNCL